MKHRTRFIRLFWISMAALGIGVTILGGCVAWKLIHSATPKIENATVDPEQLLERTVAARQAENSAVTTDTETEETTSTGNKISSTSEEEYEEFEDDENNQRNKYKYDSKPNKNFEKEGGINKIMEINSSEIP